MLRRSFPVFLLILSFAAVAGCAGLEPLEVREQKYGKHPPAITRSFASERIHANGTWKVYLNASDPDGDMKQIVCTIEQPGLGLYPTAYISIKEQSRKELAGYIYLNLLGAQNLNFVNLRLSVQIQDMAGHYSQPAVFPLSIQLGYEPTSPPPDVFPEKDLGPIMINLRSAGDGGPRRSP